MLRARFLVLLLAPLLASCIQRVDHKPLVTFQRMDVRDVTYSQVSVAFVLAVSNPNDIGVDLAQVSYQVTVDGHAFAQDTPTAPLHLPAHGTGQAIVPVTVPYAELGEPLDALFARPSVPYEFSTTLGFGTPVGVLSVPLSTSGQLPVPQIPAVQFGSAGVRNLGLTGCDLAVVINVRNTNAFAIPLGNLRYEVTLSGSPLISSLAPIGRVGGSVTTPVQLAAHINFVSAGMAILRAIKGGGATIGFDGELELGGYKMPVHVSGKL